MDKFQTCKEWAKTLRDKNDSKRRELLEKAVEAGMVGIPGTPKNSVKK